MSTAVTPPPTGIRWSSFQTAIFDVIEQGRESIVIEAGAGAAKTSSIVEAAKRLGIDVSAVFVAFNKRVADELKKKLPSHISALTLNALGNRAWVAHNETRAELDSYKVSKLIRELADDSNPDFRAGVKRLVDLAKSVGLVPARAVQSFDLSPLVQDNYDNWADLIERYDIDFGSRAATTAIDLARKVLTKNIEIGAQIIDFNDQLYLPIIFNAAFPKYDVVFVDELQDCSSINFEIIERCLFPKSRFIGVGDSAQSIYSWRGAAQDAMANARTRFNARSLSLPVCYRCPKEVVKLAQQFSPTLQAFAEAQQGKVTRDYPWTPESFRPSDVILCRNNAPLVAMAFKLIRAKKACRVLGRDIGNGLVALVKKLRALSVGDLKGKLDSYVSRETQKLHNEGKLDQITSLLDKAETLKIFIAELPSTDLPDTLIERVSALFVDDTPQGCVTLSSVHKAKGMEWPRVFILDVHLFGKYGDTQEERNCHYVAITRAQSELFYITSN